MENREGAATENFIHRTIRSMGLKNQDVEGGSETIKEIEAAIVELEEIRSFFDTVDAPELIEYAIYREKAAITRLSYLIRKVKFERTGCFNSKI